MVRNGYRHISTWLQTVLSLGFSARLLNCAGSMHVVTSQHINHHLSYQFLCSCMAKDTCEWCKHKLLQLKPTVEKWNFSTMFKRCCSCCQKALNVMKLKDFCSLFSLNTQQGSSQGLGAESIWVSPISSSIHKINNTVQPFINAVIYRWNICNKKLSDKTYIPM